MSDDVLFFFYDTDDQGYPMMAPESIKDLGDMIHEKFPDQNVIFLPKVIDYKSFPKDEAISFLQNLIDQIKAIDTIMQTNEEKNDDESIETV